MLRFAAVRLEEFVVKIFREWLFLSLPLSNLVLRLLVNVLSKDVRGSYRRIFSFPEDLSFIALSLVFAGMSGAIPSFTRFYEHHGVSPVQSGSVLALIVLGCAFVIHLIDAKIVSPNFQEVLIADRELAKRRERKRQSKANQYPPGTDEYMLKFWIEFLTGSFLWFIELMIGFYCLYYVTQTIVS